MNLGSGIRDNNAGASELALAGFFTRLNYSFSDKYFIELNGRRDGTSRFSQALDKQWGNFGAVSAGWIFSKEGFMKNVKFIDFGKLRGSIGGNGNQNIGNNYAFDAFYAQSNYSNPNNGTNAYFANTTNLGVALLQFANPSLSWETSKQMNIGLDITFAKHFTVTADYYEKTLKNMLYLRENLSFNEAKMIVESDDKDGKSLYMSGICIQGGIRNANQRVYPVNEIGKAVKTLNDQIQNGYSVLGEVDHPDDLKINLDRVSHMITNMWMEGPNGYGKFKILPTPMGNLIRTMLEAGVKLGVSSRGSGNVDDMSGKVSDFEIITVDIVAQPSAPGAYPTPVYEHLMNARGGYRALQVAKEVKEDPNFYNLGIFSYFRNNNEQK